MEEEACCRIVRVVVLVEFRCKLSSRYKVSRLAEAIRFAIERAAFEVKAVCCCGQEEASRQSMV